MEDIKKEVRDWLWAHALIILSALSLTLSGASFMMSIIGLTLVLEALEAMG